LLKGALQAGLGGREGILCDERRYAIEDTDHLIIAPYIEFRLHRTSLVFVRVQNRYLEQVVIVTGKLSASPLWILDSAKNIFMEEVSAGVEYSFSGFLAVVPAPAACASLMIREQLPTNNG
jgi:hypothetical protein